jgi:hypothetical protein
MFSFLQDLVIFSTSIVAMKSTYHKLNKEICKIISYSRHMAVPVECFFLPCRWQCHIATFFTSLSYFGTNLLGMRRYYDIIKFCI